MPDPAGDENRVVAVLPPVAREAVAATP